MFKSIHKSQKGFTLVELLVVVAIIAILAAIAIPQFSKYRETAAKGSVQSDARNCVSTCTAEYAKTNTTVTTCGCKTSSNVTCGSQSVDSSGVVTVLCSGSGAYTGACSYNASTSQVNCS